MAPSLINLIMVLLLSISAQAASLPVTCTVPAGVTASKTVYALFCETVVIDGTVSGDVVAIAGSVVINGEVQGSVLAAAAQVTVNGRVNGSIRTLSRDLKILSGSHFGTTSDVFALGLSLESHAPLPGDVWYVGRDARFYAEVLGQKYLALLPPSLPDNPGTWLAEFVWGTVQRFLVYVGAGLLMLFTRRSSVERASAVIASRPLQGLLYGEIAFFVGVPLLLLLIIGAVLALIAMTAGGLLGISLVFSVAGVLFILSAAVLLIGLFGPIVAAYGLGTWLVRNAPFNALLCGAFLIAALSSLPRVGWIAMQVIGCAGAGAWWLRNRG